MGIIVVVARKGLRRAWWCFVVLVLLTAHPRSSSAATLRVAVASNFALTMQRLATAFRTDFGHTIEVVPGSTGKHFAQIINGAPFDAFFAADAARPIRLESEGRAIPGSRLTYAVGRLVLFSNTQHVDGPHERALVERRFRRLSVANPAVAPYGRAAMQVLEKLGLWDYAQTRLLRGENVTHAFQFVSTGNADFGFVSLSQALASGSPQSVFWEVPTGYYQPITQQAVLLRQTDAGRELFEFLRSKKGRTLIRKSGYGLADN